MTGSPWAQRPAADLQHEALVYRSLDEFFSATSSFVREGVAAGEPTLVAASPDKIGNLRGELGQDAAGAEFIDIQSVGRNPARLTALWHDFVAAHPGQRLRGIGEPVWPERTPDELVECAAHEHALNLVLEGADLWLLCPYDGRALPDEALTTALRTHPELVAEEGRRRSSEYGNRLRELLGKPLPEPSRVLDDLPFERSLSDLRKLVADRAAEAGLDEARRQELVLAANEAAANSLRHGGGSGRLRTWSDNGSLVCEIADRGRLDEPLAGRRRPGSPDDGAGLWLANQLCDLVQLRSSEQGTQVRLHMSLS